MAKADESKNRICEAAIEIAARDGFASMSLDAVAAEAGVSKGSLLYHFRTKEDLVQGTLAHFAESVRRMLLERIAADPTPRMRWARGIVSCMFPADEELDQGEQELDPQLIFKFMLSMLTVAADRSTGVEPLARLGAELQGQFLEDDDTALEQLLICLAIDGLAVWQLLGMIDPQEDLFERVGSTLRERVGLPERNKKAKTAAKSRSLQRSTRVKSKRSHKGRGAGGER